MKQTEIPRFRQNSMKHAKARRVTVRGRKTTADF
jgi:hypothetical protein